MHQGKSLASFPGAEDAAVIDFVLRLGKYADSSVAPIRIRSECVGNNGGLSLGGQLGVLIESNALCEKRWIKRNRDIGVTGISSAPAFKQKLTKEKVIWSEGIRRSGISKTKTLLNGEDEKGGIRGGLVAGCQKGRRLAR